MMAVRKKKKAQTGFVRALLLCVLIIAVVGGLFIVPMGNKLYDALSGYMFPSFAQEGCGDRAEDSIDALVFAIDCTALQAHKDESGDDTEFTDYGCPETDEKIKFGSTAYVQNSSDDPYYHVHNLDISQDFKEDISGSLFRHAINFARGYGAPECIVYYEQFPQEEMDQWKMDPNRISWAAIGTSATIGLAGEGFSALKYIGKGVKAVGSGTKGVVKATASIGSKDFINFGVKIRSHIDNAMIKKIEKESIMSIVTGSGRVTEETLISMYKFGADRILRLTGTAAEIPAKIALEVSSAAVDDALKGYLTKDKIKKIFKNELSSEASSIMLEKEIYTEITEISQLELVKDVGFFEAKKDMDLTWDISLENEITAQADAIFKADGDVCKGVYASVTNNVKITDLVKAKSITGDGSEVVTEKLANAVNIAYAMKEKSWLRKAMEFAHILKKQKEAKIDWDNANKVIEKQYNKLRGLQIDDPTTAKKVALYGTYLGDAALHTTSGKIMISDNIGYIWDATIAEQKEWEEFIDCSGIDDDEGNKIHVLGNSDSYCHDEFVEIEEYMPDGKSIEAFGKCFVMKTYVGRVGCITAVAIGVSAQEIYDETLRMTPVGINAIGNMQVGGEPRIRYLHDRTNEFYVQLSREVSADTRLFLASPCYAEDIRIRPIATSCVPIGCEGSKDNEPKLALDEDGHILLYDESGKIIGRSEKQDKSFLGNIIDGIKAPFDDIISVVKGTELIDFCEEIKADNTYCTAVDCTQYCDDPETEEIEEYDIIECGVCEDSCSDLLGADLPIECGTFKYGYSKDAYCSMKGDIECGIMNVKNAEEAAKSCVDTKDVCDELKKTAIEERADYNDCINNVDDDGFDIDGCFDEYETCDNPEFATYYMCRAEEKLCDMTIEGGFCDDLEEDLNADKDKGCPDSDIMWCINYNTLKVLYGQELLSKSLNFVLGGPALILTKSIHKEFDSTIDLFKEYLFWGDEDLDCGDDPYYHNWDIFEDYSINKSISGTICGKFDLDENRRSINDAAEENIGYVASTCGGATIEKDFWTDDDVYYTAFPMAYTAGVDSGDFDKDTLYVKTYTDEDEINTKNLIEVSSDVSHYVYRTKGTDKHEEISTLAFRNSQADYAYGDFYASQVVDDFPIVTATADSISVKICNAPKWYQDGEWDNIFIPWSADVLYHPMAISVEFMNMDGDYIENGMIKPPDGSEEYYPNYCYSEASLEGVYVKTGFGIAIVIAEIAASVVTSGTGIGPVVVGIVGGGLQEYSNQYWDTKYNSKWPFHNTDSQDKYCAKYPMDEGCVEMDK